MYFAIGMAKNAEMCEKTGRSVLRRIQSLPLGAKFVLIEVEYRGKLISPRMARYRHGRYAQSANFADAKADSSSYMSGFVSKLQFQKKKPTTRVGSFFWQRN